MNKLLIRLPLMVEDFNALAGYYTAGPSMAALHGLVSHIEREVSAEFGAVAFDQFGLLLDSYTSRLGEHLKTGYDVIPAEKQRQQGGQSGYRYASLSGAVYLTLSEEGLSLSDVPELLAAMAKAVNRTRFQGGKLIRWVSAEPNDPCAITFAPVADEQEALKFILSSERKSAQLYLSKHLPEACNGEAMLDAFAEHLTAATHVLMCNGYVEVGQLVDKDGVAHTAAEPCFTLAEQVPLFQIQRATPDEQDEAISRFFWSFDEALREQDPRYFTIK